MEGLLNLVGPILTPGKVVETDKMVATDAKNGASTKSTERVSQPQAADILSAENDANETHPDAKTEIAKTDKFLVKKGKNTPKPNEEAPADECGMCIKSIKLSKYKCGVNCDLCDTLYCVGCADFTPTQVSKVLDRVDVMWACYNCVPRLNNMKLATPLAQEEGLTQISAEIQTNGESVMRKFDDLKGEVNNLKAQVSEAVTGLEKMSGNMERQFRQIMNDTIFGDDFPDFDPNISHKQAKRIAAEQNRTPPPTLNTVMKTAVVEQKKEEKKEDAEKAIARCNIIIYGIEEPKEEDGEKRNEHNRANVDELFSFLEVESIIPIKTHRLGKFRDDGKPRPLKVILDNQIEAETVVKNCKKLRDAPTQLKTYSVSHDLTNEERIAIKSLVNQAKDQTAKSPNMDFKVVGPPWQPTIKSFKKRATVATGADKDNK